MKILLLLGVALLLTSCIIIPGGGWHEHRHWHDRYDGDGYRHDRR